ncbi:hypothetical protein MJD09_00095 [bacterium]|nr:hypothetical protein [bacterium]
MADSEGLILGLTKQWRKRQFVGLVLSAGAVAILLACPLRFWLGLSVLPSLGFCFLAWIVGFVLSFLFKKHVHPEELAEHLNRTVPDLEESSALFLPQESSLSVMNQMQRRRLTDVLHKLPSGRLLPTRPARQALIYFAVSLTLTSAAVAFIPKDVFQKEGFAGKGSVTKQELPADRRLPEVQSARLRIEPPAYTGMKSRLVDQLNIEVAEGSVVAWEIEMNREIQKLTLAMSSGDSIPLEPTGHRRYTGQIQVWESSLYNLFIETSAGTRSSEYFEVQVIKDAPPTVMVIDPKRRTTIEPTQLKRIDLTVTVDDDYAVADARIVATVSKGSGEGIKFREEILTFDERAEKSKGSYEYRRSLELDRLGMALGDELYFFVEAWDNRIPAPNWGRSETYFVVMEDTSAPVLISDFGLGINPLPEYFRSQRQIIIDTEKLLQEKDQIGEAEFKRRSNNLGIDQKALRLRYGQFLGEEADEFAIQSTDANEPQTPSLDESAEHREEMRNPEEQEESIPSDLMHEHDYAENATLFGESIKTQLKAALAEMWDAELNLRTFKTQDALPFEYRALVLLKRVQQQARIYVKRIGFEPPPLEPDQKRLSGDLSNIESKTTTNEIRTKRDPSHDIRAGLQIVMAWKRGRPVTSVEQTEILERAGRVMARQALDQPGSYLRALNDLRILISSADEGAPQCHRCLLSVERAFWRLLPKRHPLPERQRPVDSDLSRRYSKRLGTSF